MEAFMHLKEYLKTKGMSLSIFCKNSGIDKSMVCNIASGRQRVGRSVACKISAATAGSVTIAELLLTDAEITQFLDSIGYYG